MGLSPDMLVLGKGTSDMMFPFALTLYSSALQARLEQQGSDLPTVIRKRYGYQLGYRTVLNVLRQAEELQQSDRVAETGKLIAQLLGEGLARCKAVREVRVHGLLVGIELRLTGWLQRSLRKRLYLLYILGMLRHPRFPVLMGYCQYEPNVLKFTPPLTVTPAEIREACATIVEVLNRPLYRLFPPVVAGWMRSLGIRRPNHEHGNPVNGTAHELAPR
jgi:4-aminobutyrate aminotransferase-like enzyme